MNHGGQDDHVSAHRIGVEISVVEDPKANNLLDQILDMHSLYRFAEAAPLCLDAIRIKAGSAFFFV